MASDLVLVRASRRCTVFAVCRTGGKNWTQAEACETNKESDRRAKSLGVLTRITKESE